jgi:hypothetical protein
VVLPPAGGTAPLVLPIPPQPSVGGIELHAQALFAWPDRLRLSGTVHNTVVR